MFRFRTPLAALLAAICALFAPISLAAQTAPPPAAASANANPALWKIADADTTIYLFGTIHLLPQGIEWYGGPVSQAFDSSGELITEIPAYGDTETAAAVMKYAIMPEKQSLRGMMTRTEKVRFEAALRSVGLPPAAFDRFRPWYAAVLLATLPLQRSGYNMEHGVEAHLSELAAKTGKPRTGLETLDMQLGLFGGFNAKVQKRYLFDTIGSMPTIEEEIEKMVASWAKGDALVLAELLKSDQNDPAMMKALLYDRNRAWAQWIKTRLDRPGTVFIAVGAGHLGGKGSVQDVLAKTGITASRVQ
ncbi:TraB/GumN family protein [Novosphingobium sp.]|uniref:TraB/GumN family protein n=1 Tax=Novosphingobium sp. TaxID=1874826 RepID=UPI0025FD0ACF|nr:TraB/GumN family protein [Novosphingobium sp.]